MITIPSLLAGVSGVATIVSADLARAGAATSGGGSTPTPTPTLTLAGALTAATVGTTTPFTPVITGGTAQYILSLLSGTLPAGRSISGLSVTGTYTTAGSYSYVLRVTDGAGVTANLAVGPVVVSAVADTTPPTITSTSAHSVNENAAYGATATANEAVTWAKGGIDAGLVTLNASTGAWSVAAQDFEARQVVGFTLIATDTAGNASSAQMVTLTIVNLNDTNPSAFAFAPASGVTLSSTQTSPVITIAGLGASDSVSAAVSGAVGSLLSKNGAAFVAGPVTVVNGDTLAVQHTASGANATAVSTTLAAGTATATFTSTTNAAAGAPSGFALNGSSNTALKAMLARVQAGTGRGAIVHKGDSTTAGVGASIESGTGTVVQQYANARPFRPSAVLASQLSSVGYAALDGAFVGDQYAAGFSTTLPAYDTRVSFPATPWGYTSNMSFAGGCYLVGQAAGRGLDFTPTTAVNTFVIVIYNTAGGHTITIDGASPATLTAAGATISGNTVTPPNTSTGFTRIIATTASVGTHTVRVTSVASSSLLRSVQAYDSTARAIDILNHSAAGATTAQQATAGSSWSNNDALGFDAPDLTIINLGLNDATGNDTAAYTTNLNAIITKAKLSGDVLLVSPHPANPTFAATSKQENMRNTAQSVGAAAGVAYMDLYTYFGSWAAVSSRTADGQVHPNKGMYAEIGEVYRRCIQAMAA